jgi:hypothetical protein
MTFSVFLVFTLSDSETENYLIHVTLTWLVYMAVETYVKEGLLLFQIINIMPINHLNNEFLKRIVMEIV